MIVNAILAIVYGVTLLLTFPVRVLDDVVLDPAIAASISEASVSLDIISTVFPVATILSILALVVSVEIAILLWHGVNWLIRRIPTQN